MKKTPVKRRGQASSELMMVLAVCIIAITAAAFEFVPSFRHGVHGLASDVRYFLASNSTSQTDDGGVSGSTDRSVDCDFHHGVVICDE